MWVAAAELSTERTGSSRNRVPRGPLVQHRQAPVAPLRRGQQVELARPHPHRPQPQWRQLTQPEARTSGPAHSGHTRTAVGGKESGDVTAGAGTGLEQGHGRVLGFRFLFGSDLINAPRTGSCQERWDTFRHDHRRVVERHRAMVRRRRRRAALLPARPSGSVAQRRPCRPARPGRSLGPLPHAAGRRPPARHRAVRAGPPRQRPLAGAAGIPGAAGRMCGRTCAA